MSSLTDVEGLLEQWDYAKNAENPLSISRGSNKRYWWKCLEGHEFQAAPNSRYDRKALVVRSCKICVRLRKSSALEREVLAFCQTLCEDVEGSSPKVLPGRFLDIYSPEAKVALEVNGDYWHSDGVMSAKYGINAYSHHLERQRAAAKEGVALVYLWEASWREEQDEAKEALRALFTQGVVSPLLQRLTNGQSEYQKKGSREKEPSKSELACEARRSEVLALATSPGVSRQEAARRLGVPKNSFFRWLEREGIPWTYVGFTVLEKSAVEALAEAPAIPQKEAAKLLGVNPRTLTKNLLFHGIEWKVSRRAAKERRYLPHRPRKDPP